MTKEAVQEFKRAAEYLKRNNRTDDYLRVAERLSTLEPENIALAKELARHLPGQGRSEARAGQAAGVLQGGRPRRRDAEPAGPGVPGAGADLQDGVRLQGAGQGLPGHAAARRKPTASGKRSPRWIRRTRSCSRATLRPLLPARPRVPRPLRLRPVRRPLPLPLPHGQPRLPRQLRLPRQPRPVRLRRLLRLPRGQPRLRRLLRLPSPRSRARRPARRLPLRCRGPRPPRWGRLRRA